MAVYWRGHTEFKQTLKLSLSWTSSGRLSGGKVKVEMTVPCQKGTEVKLGGFWEGTGCWVEDTRAEKRGLSLGSGESRLNNSQDADISEKSEDISLGPGQQL